MTPHKHGPLTLQGRHIIDESGHTVALVLMPQYGDVLARSTHLEVACGAALGWMEREIHQALGRFDHYAKIDGKELDSFVDTMLQITFVLRAALAPQVPVKVGLREQEQTA